MLAHSPRSGWVVGSLTGGRDIGEGHGLGTPFHPHFFNPVAKADKDCSVGLGGR